MTLQIKLHSLGKVTEKDFVEVNGLNAVKDARGDKPCPVKMKLKRFKDMKSASSKPSKPRDSCGKRVTDPKQSKGDAKQNGGAGSQNGGGQTVNPGYHNGLKSDAMATERLLNPNRRKSDAKQTEGIRAQNGGGRTMNRIYSNGSEIGEVVTESIPTLPHCKKILKVNVQQLPTGPELQNNRSDQNGSLVGSGDLLVRDCNKLSQTGPKSVNPCGRVLEVRLKKLPNHLASGGGEDVNVTSASLGSLSVDACERQLGGSQYDIAQPDVGNKNILDGTAISSKPNSSNVSQVNTKGMMSKIRKMNFKHPKKRVRFQDECESQDSSVELENLNGGHELDHEEEMNTLESTENVVHLPSNVSLNPTLNVVVPNATINMVDVASRADLPERNTSSLLSPRDADTSVVGTPLPLNARAHAGPTAPEPFSGEDDEGQMDGVSSSGDEDSFSQLLTYLKKSTNGKKRTEHVGASSLRDKGQKPVATQPRTTELGHQKIPSARMVPLLGCFDHTRTGGRKRNSGPGTFPSIDRAGVASPDPTLTNSHVPSDLVFDEEDECEAHSSLDESDHKRKEAAGYVVPACRELQQSVHSVITGIAGVTGQSSGGFEESYHNMAQRKEWSGNMVAGRNELLEGGDFIITSSGGPTDEASLVFEESCHLQQGRSQTPDVGPGGVEATRVLGTQLGESNIPHDGIQEPELLSMASERATDLSEGMDSPVQSSAACPKRIGVEYIARCNDALDSVNSQHVNMQPASLQIRLNRINVDPDEFIQTSPGREIHKINVEVKDYVLPGFDVPLVPHEPLEPPEPKEAQGLECWICGKPFKDKRALNVHFLIHVLEKPHKCGICARGFHRKGDLNKHMATHLQIRKYFCTYCDMGFVRKSSLLSHIHTHTKEKPFQCTICKERFGSRGSLRYHKTSHHMTKKEKQRRRCQCPVCMKMFPSKRALTIHLRIHYDDRPYKCEKCGKTFKQACTLSNHKATHLNEKPFDCYVCGKTFRQTSELQAHIRVHTKERPFKCSYCERTFAQAGHRTNHERSHTGNRPFSCKVCGRAFVVKAGMKRHMLVHTGEKRWECKRCGKKYSLKQALVRHENVGHQKQLTYKCTVCGFAFGYKQSLDSHIQTVHAGERPYPCLFCDKAFGRLSARIVHMRVHTGEKPYECKHCGKRFNQVSQVKRHERNHTGEKAFQCKYCDQRFAHSTSMNTHIRTFHTFEKPYVCKVCGEAFAESHQRSAHMHIHTNKKNPRKCYKCNKFFMTRQSARLHRRNVHDDENATEIEEMDSE